MTTALRVLFAGLLALTASPANRATRVAAGKRTPAYDVSTVNDPEEREEVNPRSTGSAVLRAQILLDRAHFSAGEIDGRWGDNLRVAILGYQTAHKLNPTGIVDQATWQLLNADTAPALVPYIIAPDDVAGPFTRIPRTIVAQSTLNRLGYQSAQERLGERSHINPGLLGQLNPRKVLTKAGQEIFSPNVQREYSLPADQIVVSKNNRTVSAFRADGMLLAQYSATVGSEHDPLPIGDWKITEIDHYPWFNYNPLLFWDAKRGDSKARIPPGPNNPVGIVWIGLSKEHYGIHGTPEPNRIGHTESHGCIRLTNWDAEELSKMVKIGTPAILKE